MSLRPSAELPLVSIVLPIYNEAAILREHTLLLIRHVRTLERQFRFEFIMVNDGSADDSGQIAERLAVEYDFIRVLRHPRNFGLGQALRTGFAQCRGDYVIVLDIDLSYGPEHIELMLDPMCSKGTRVVLASPYMRGGKVIAVPWLRLALSRLANRFLARVSGHPFSTLTCMVRGFDGRFLRSLHLRGMGMDVMPEIIHKAKILGASFAEIPAELNWQLQNRAPGRRSSMRIVRHIFGTMTSGFMLRPFTFLLAPGLLLLALACYVDSWVIIHVMEAHAELVGLGKGDVSDAVAIAYARFPHTFIVGLLSLMLGIQLTGMAMLSLQNKKYFDELFHLGSALLRGQRELAQPSQQESKPADGAARGERRKRER